MISSNGMPIYQLYNSIYCFLWEGIKSAWIKKLVTSANPQGDEAQIKMYVKSIPFECVN
jgi:hypothetical protein